MSHVRIYAEKDTYITEKSLTANNGNNPVLEVWNKYDALKSKKEWARILIKFPFENIKDSVDNGDMPDPRTDTSISAFINMKNVKHGESVASDFDIWALPLTASWVEGKGLDSETYEYEDVANALSATNTMSWEDYNGGASGGNVVLGAHNKEWDSNSGSQYFEHGEENLKIDVTNYLKEFLDGNSANHGFMIRMSDIQEAKSVAEAQSLGVNESVATTDWFSKKFYSRETNTTNVPFVSLEWDSSIRDDRSRIPFSGSASLFYYNFKNGQLVDLDGAGKFPGTISLSADGELIEPAGLTAARYSKGVYVLNIGTAKNDNNLDIPLTGINISLSSAQSFSDVWTITSTDEALITSKTFYFDTKLPQVDAANFYELSKYIVKMPNLKNSYEKGTNTFIKLFIKDLNARLESITGLSNNMSSFICNDGYVDIREKITDAVEVENIKLSYDQEGNYFPLNTNNLYRDVEYKIVVRLNIRGEVFYYDQPESWSFTVK